MKNDNDLFSKPKRIKNKNPYFKYVVIAFSLFIVILGVFSAFLFMRSIDFDFNNLVDRATEEPSSDILSAEPIYSASALSGKTEYLFMITDGEHNADFGFIINADFDNQSITVTSFDANERLSDGKTYAEIYKNEFVSGLKNHLNSDYSVSVDKYIICSQAQFKKLISSFGGVAVNVTEDINYKSSDYNLCLDKGVQKLSDEYTYKYLAISDVKEKARIMCDVLKSILTPEYAQKSDELFKNLVNNSDTDISVIDYSNALEKLIIYSNAEDKPYPVVVD